MGDRVSIQFRDANGYVSAVLKSHWGGMEFVEGAQAWLRSFKASRKPGAIQMPEDRLEADSLMVYFIRDNATPGDLRIVPTQNDCDNSDNGHHILDTATGDEIDPTSISSPDAEDHAPSPTPEGDATPADGLRGLASTSASLGGSGGGGGAAGASPPSNPPCGTCGVPWDDERSVHTKVSGGPGRRRYRRHYVRGFADHRFVLTSKPKGGA